MRINKERLLSEFTSLVAIDSKSFDEKKMGAYIKRRLTLLGLNIYEDGAGERHNGNCGNIYGYLNGNIGADPVLFCAHMDTVEPSQGKQAIIGEDGVIRSDGTTVLGADDCSGITALLEALTVIKEQHLPHPPIEVLFTIAEEVYCKGASFFDFSRILSKQAYVLDLTGLVGSAAYKAPSILSFNATITGRASHAGFAPEKGIHAIQAAARAIAALELGHIDDETTLNIGVMQGGLALNIVPEMCRVSGEIRSYSHTKALQAVNNVKERFEQSASMSGARVDFEVETHCEAYEIELNHPVVNRFKKACSELGFPAALLKTFGGSDNHHLAQRGIPGLVIANAMYNCHSCHEYTTIDELCRIGELTLSLMLSQD
jgi:peptidase T-like protein